MQRSKAESGTAGLQEPQAAHFLILKKYIFTFGAQGLYKTVNLFPFYAYTLRSLVPRCCRVTLQPGLLGQNSISFSQLQFAQTFVPKPDWNRCRFSFKIGRRESGTEGCQELLHLHFLTIKKLSLKCLGFRLVRHQPIAYYILLNQVIKFIQLRRKYNLYSSVFTSSICICIGTQRLKFAFTSSRHSYTFYLLILC